MSKFILRFLGLLLFVIVIVRFNWQSFYSILLELRPQSLIIACFLNVLRLFVETLRWNKLLKIQKISYKLKDAFLVFLSSAYAGTITPGGIGNFIRIFYLKDDVHISIGAASSSVIMDKLIELLTVIGFGWWGLILLNIGIKAITVISLSILLLSLFFLLISYKKLHILLERFLIKLFKVAKDVGRFDEEREIFYKFFRQLINIRLLEPVALSFLAFIILLIQAFFVADALNIQLSFIDLAKTFAFTRLISRVIPVSFLGLGSKDITFMAILNKMFKIEAIKGIAFSIIFLFTSYFITAFVGAVCWLIKPIKIERS